MPLYYNPSPPNPTTKNTINSVTIGTFTGFNIRDFLLNKNLLPVYPNALALSPGTVKIGEPILDTSINNNTNVVPFGLPLETEGLLRYDIAILPNQFKNMDINAPSLINIEDIPTTQGIFGDVDFPQGIQSYPTTANDDVTNYGLLGKTAYANFLENSTLFNLYVDTEQQVDVSDWISLQPLGISQQINNYMDEYGNLNLGNSDNIQTINIIGSVLNGQGLGFTKGGIVNNFDIKSSIAGSVLGATGVIKDTKLGNIGAQQLALALANNAAFNLEQSIIGSLNIEDNLLSLVKDGSLVGTRPNYKITIPRTGAGRVLDFTERLLGFTVPRSYLQDSGSIFQSESFNGNIERANAMIENTGKGQVLALIENVNANLIGTTQYDNPDKSPFRSGYAPGYLNNKGDQAINPSLYAFYDDATKGTISNFLTDTSNVIPEISYNRSSMIEKYGFTAPQNVYSETIPNLNTSYDNRKVNDVGYTWSTANGNAANAVPNIGELQSDSKKTLLAKTQKLFNSERMLNLVSVKGSKKSADGEHSSQIQTANGYLFSKGSAVISGTRFSERGVFDGEKQDADNTFCRSWTTLDRYDKVSKLVRHRGLDTTYPYRYQMEGSVLDDNGYVKISPYKTDSVDSIKKYMFSIENLAWFDTFENLIPCEQGPGDLLTGKRGRIMWFPPYDIQFSESSDVNWESTNFIGRGEPVYSYNNTERGGNLSFKIIVDHPSYVNSFAGSGSLDDNYVASFFAGCAEPNQFFVDRLTVSDLSSLAVNNATIPQTQNLTSDVPPPDFELFFPNDITDIDFIATKGYEDGTTGSTEIDYSQYPTGEGFGIKDYTASITISNKIYTDNYNYGLNYKGPYSKVYDIGGTTVYGHLDPNFYITLDNYLKTSCPSCKVTITGYASSQGNPDTNKKLAEDRAKNVLEFLKTKLFTNITVEERAKHFAPVKSGVLKSIGCVVKDDAPTDTLPCKQDRKVTVTFIADPNLIPTPFLQVAPVTPLAAPSPNRNLNNRIRNRFYSECSYFEKLTDEDPFVFDTFRNKIRYFHPAFHSTTPEGLNSRLTFLQQCTRQGPTLESKGATNLAFGRPPICILRIGDFYNTKIVINNLQIDYEPLVWDLNPEGVGVQPMIANINISFKFIGGSTLMGPINKLQNALSFNYYANTHVYDPRADYIAKTNDLKKKEQGLTVKEGLNFEDRIIYGSNEFSILNGIADANAYSAGEVITTNSITNNTAEINQVQTLNDELVTQTNQQPLSDSERIKLVSVTVVNDGLTSPKFKLVFNIVGGTSDLTKFYDFRAVLNVFGDVNSEGVEIGVGTINKTGAEQTKEFFINNITLVPNKIYSIMAKFGSFNVTNVLTYTT